MEDTAEFDSVETIEAIDTALRNLGHETERIGHMGQLRSRLARGGRWHMVFNIAEGLWDANREARVPALLEGFGVPCTFSDARVLTAGLHKGISKQLAQHAGVRTADFEVVATAADVEPCRLSMPLFVKPVAEGSSKGITGANVVASRQEMVHRCGALLERYRQPVLVETYLPGREFTVGLVGTGEHAKVLGVMEILHGSGAEAGGYTYANKANFGACVRYELATDGKAILAGAMALRAWRFMGGRDAGRVDMRCDANGDPHFLEVNPLAGLHPESSDLPILCRQTGISYEELIDLILTSACRRIP
jgi:D-alanine-D-alanine ligase